MGARKRKNKRKEKGEGRWGSFAPGGIVLDCRVAALLAMTGTGVDVEGGSETPPGARAMGDQSFSRVISWWRREVMGPVP